MTVLVSVVFLAVAALILRGRARFSRRQLAAALDEARAQAEKNAETVRDLHMGRQQAAEAVADLDTRLIRITTERDAAILAGQRAATAALLTLYRERERHADDLAAAYTITLHRAALPAGERRALPAGERDMPELLSGGEHAVVAPGLLLQLDEWEPLPVGTTGTNGAGGEQ